MVTVSSSAQGHGYECKVATGLQAMGAVTDLD